MDGVGELPGSQPKVLSVVSWEGGRKAVVKPDVCWVSPAEQVGQDGATLANLMPATASQPPAVTFQSHCHMAAWRQRRCCGEAASSFLDSFG